MLTARHKLDFKTGKRSAKKIVEADRSQAAQPSGRLPRITKMMALAIRLDHLIKTRQVTDQAELARVGHVSRARLTQIMNLLYLPPRLQEEILTWPSAGPSRDIDEKWLRTLASDFNWQRQLRAWESHKQSFAPMILLKNHHNRQPLNIQNDLNV